MDDADGIIIPILRSIGCNIPEEITSAAQFDADHLVHAIARCLHRIHDEKYMNIPEKLPSSIAKKVKVGTQITNAFRDLNYRGEVGYDKIIYPNEKDTRSLLRFMMERLPKDGDKKGKMGENDEEELEGVQGLDSRIHDALKSWMKTASSPLNRQMNVGQFRTCALDYPMRPIHEALSKGRVSYCQSKALEWLPAQPSDYQWLIPSVLARNHEDYAEDQAKTDLDEEERDLLSELIGESVHGDDQDQSLSQILRGCISTEVDSARIALRQKQQGRGAQGFAAQRRSSKAKNTAFSLQKNYTQSQGVTARAVDDSGKLVTVDATGNEVEQLDDEEQEKQRRKELAEMKAAVAKLQEKLKKMDIEIEKQEKSYEQRQGELTEESKRCEELQREAMTKKKTIDLIPNAQQNLLKLAKIVESSQQRYDALKRQWETKKMEVAQELRKRKEEVEMGKQRAKDLLAEIKSMRREMRECANEIREREQMATKMAAKLNKLPKTVDRQVYVDRILGVVQNLENQNQQIRRILEDVNNLQRDTNTVVDKSKRIFGVVDNLVFTAASNEKELTAKRQLNQIYRHVVSMREYFDGLVDSARSISNTQNEIRDLEYQIVALREKVESLEMKKIKHDLKEVEQENEELASRLKMLKKQLKKAAR